MARVLRAHLRLVEKAPERRSVESYDFSIADTGAPLFSDQHPNLLVFAALEGLTGSELLSLIARALPTQIIDLRTSPRFDLRGTNRREILEQLQGLGVRYYDIAAICKRDGIVYSSSDATSMAVAIQHFASRRKQNFRGPIIFFCDENFPGEAGAQEIASGLDDFSSKGWDLVCIPEYNSDAKSHAGKSLVFISHAAPEDSDFARWLASQLMLAGYDVWVDLNQLAAGEAFWDTIEHTIRHRSAKFLVAISRLSQVKDGVLDELNLAIMCERAAGLKEFVLPLKIDDLPFHEIRANIARKNIVDFSRNWADGLAAVIDALDRDRVPRSGPSNAAAVLDAVVRRRAGASGLVKAEERILLNWLDVSSMPRAIYAHSISPIARLPSLSQMLDMPHVVSSGLFVSFLPTAELVQRLPVGVGAAMDSALLAEDFLRCRENLHSRIPAREHRKIFASLIRQSWEKFAKSRGLRAYQLSSQATAWFVPQGALPDGKVQFRDFDGKSRRKSLVGFSAKRAVFWHFAIELRLLPGSPLRMVAKPHVVFTEDGATPLDSAAKMHALRRGFCKTWWNDRWRDLTVGMIEFLGEGGDLHLPLSEEGFVTVRGSMSTISSPFSLADSEGLGGHIMVDENFEDLDDAELDEEEEIFFPNPGVV